jgi:hypothetical protein
MLEPSDYDSTKAAEFGDRLYLFPSKQNPLKLQDLVEATLDRLDEIDYEPDDDYICTTGSMLGVMIFMMTIVAGYGKCKMLMFDARSATYVPRVFDSDTLPEPKE